jgi:hypothetical protein
MAVLQSKRALVNVRTGNTVACPSGATITCETVRRVGARRLRVTVVRVIGALVQLHAVGAIAAVARVARAAEAALRVGAHGIRVATVEPAATLVDIDALVDAVARKTGNACAAEAADRFVAARRIHVTPVRVQCALVNVGAGDSVARVAKVARAGETAFGVCAARFLIAVVHVLSALVQLRTAGAIAAVARVTRTGEAALSVGAGGIAIAVIVACGALVELGTADAIAAVSEVARAGETARRVGARCIVMAVLGRKQHDAFVVVCAVDAAARVPRGADAREAAALELGAGCKRVAVVDAC